DLAPGTAEPDAARSRSRGEIEVARREPRQADRRQQRSHRQILAVRDEVRLVVAADDPAAGGERVDAILGAQAVGCLNRDPTREQPVAGAEQAGCPSALELREGLAFGRAGVLQRL